MIGWLAQRAHRGRFVVLALVVSACLGCGGDERRGDRQTGNDARAGHEERSDGTARAQALPMCTAVHDGDTITILDVGNREVRVRLAEIDAPEKAQEFGDAAKDHLAALVFGKTVELRGNERDQYDRRLAHVHVAGTWVNRQMVVDGFAWQFDRYSKSNELAEAEQTARRAHRGLWRDRHPTPPWEWRRARRGGDR